MNFQIVGRCVAPAQLAPALEALQADGVVFNTIYRGEDAKALLHKVGQHTQAELFNASPAQRAAWGVTGGVNPPGFSQHELRNSVGQPIPYWQVGMDIANTAVAYRSAAAHGWHLHQPYSTESWHLQFTEEPHLIMKSFVEGVDTIGQDLDRLSAIPYWNNGVRLIGSYTTRIYAASAAQWQRIRVPAKYDQAPTDWLAGGAWLKDVESGAASITNAVNAAKSGAKMATYLPHLQNGFSLAECRVAMVAAGVHNMQYVVADWRYNQAAAIDFMYANNDVVGVQWASPSSNPNTLLPGTNLTLRQMNADLSVWRPDWHTRIFGALPQPVTAAQGIWVAELHYDPQHRRMTISGRPGTNVKMGSKNVVTNFSGTVNEHSGHWTVKIS